MLAPRTRSALFGARATLFSAAAVLAPSAALAQECTIDRIGDYPLTGPPTDLNTRSPAITPDGRFLAFESGLPTFVPNDTNASHDVFVQDRLLGTFTRANITSGGAQSPASSCGSVSISADGRFVCFTTTARLVVADTNNVGNIYVRDLLLNTTEIVDVSNTGVVGNLGGTGAICAAGTFVAFESDSNNLVPADSNTRQDVFVRDLVAHTTVRVSISDLGEQSVEHSHFGSISSEGRYVSFHTLQGIVSGDTNSANDVFVRDMLLGTVERVSVSTAGALANGPSSSETMSRDGRFVLFLSGATNLDPRDTTNDTDLYLHDRLSGETRYVNVHPLDGTANAEQTDLQLSADARRIYFRSGASNIDPRHPTTGPTTWTGVFVHDLVTHGTELQTLAYDGMLLSASADVEYSIDDAGTVVFTTTANNAHPSHPLALTSQHDLYVTRCTHSPFGTFCYGSLAACPCGNVGLPGRGCGNSSNVDGARLEATGTVLPDSVTLTVTGLPASSPCFYIQAQVDLNQSPGTGAVVFGDGSRCIGGAIVRLGSLPAVAGVSQFPYPGDASISQRSAARGDAIGPGDVRYYQTYYRNSNFVYCPPPYGGAMNVTNALVIAW